MRRRALLAASAASGGSGELPTIPDGFFPLYLTHDSYDKWSKIYIFNPSDTTQELWNIVFGYATKLGEYDVYGYDFYPVEHGIEVYLDGYQITNFYVYLDGHAELFFDNVYIEGNFNSDKSLMLWERR